MQVTRKIKLSCLSVFLVFTLTTNSRAQEALSLMQVVSIGLEYNYAVQIYRNNAAIAANTNTVGNAGMLPTIDLEVVQNNSVNTTNQRTLAGSENDVVNAKSNNINAGVGLNWTIFDGFSMFIQKDMLNTLESLGATEARLAIENTIEAIILGYYSLVQQQEVIQVLNDAVALSIERRKVAEARLTVGSGSKLALLQATVDLNADSALLIQEKAILFNLQANLNLLMGRDPTTSFSATDSINLDNPVNLADVLEKTSSRNANLELIRQRLTLSNLAVKQAQSARYPRVSLQASYGYNQLSAETGYLAYNRAFGPKYGVTLSYSLFDGMKKENAIINRRLELENTSLDLKNTEIQIKTEVVILYNDYLSNLDIIKLEELNLLVASENVEVAFEKYRLGSISDIELRETQKKLIEAQYQLVSSRFKAKQAETGLRRICGELKVE